VVLHVTRLGECGLITPGDKRLNSCRLIRTVISPSGESVQGMPSAIIFLPTSRELDVTDTKSTLALS